MIPPRGHGRFDAKPSIRKSGLEGHAVHAFPIESVTNQCEKGRVPSEVQACDSGGGGIDNLLCVLGLTYAATFPSGEVADRVGPPSAWAGVKSTLVLFYVLMGHQDGTRK
jgi:hypothetical protein